MDLTDIDNWYEEKKEELVQVYLSKLQQIEIMGAEKKKLLKVKYQKEFSSSLKELHQKYEQKTNVKIRNNLNKHNRDHNLSKYKKRLFDPLVNLKEKYSKHFYRKQD